MPKKKCEIWVVVIGVLIIAMVQPAVAQPQAVSVWGLVTYDNSTVVPDGWNVSIEDLDSDQPGEPWNTTTDYATWGATGHNYYVGGSAITGDRLQVTVISPDMEYTGTATGTVVGAGLQDEINVTVYGPTTVTVVYPNGGEEITIGTSVDVSADVVGGSDVTSVVFEYSSDNGGSWNSIGSGTLVSGTVTDGTWNATWDTLGLPVGNEYLVKANATDSGGLSGEDQSDSTFSLVDRTKPIVINGSANPSTIAINTDFAELRVDVADRDSVIDNVTIDLSPIGGEADTRMFNIGNYSQGGLLWTMYNYTTNSSVEGTFNLAVNATDIYGNYNDTVDITLDVVSEMSYNITIYNGWNLISLPVTPADLSLGVVIGGDAVVMDQIYEYDNVAGYSSSMYTGAIWAGTVTTFEPGKGYWYNRQGSEFTLTVTGQPPTGTITTPIYNGWNLVGYQSMQSQSIDIIGGDAVVMDQIYEYDNVAGYSSSMYTGAIWAGTVTTFEPGKGYWYNRQGSQFDWMYTS